MEEAVDGVRLDKRTGRIFFDQKNIRDCRESVRAGDNQESQYETVIASEWDRFIRVVRDEQLDPSVVSYLKTENFPSVHQTLGPMNFLFGNFFFPGKGEYVHLPDMLRSLEPNNVTINDVALNRKEIRFVHQGCQCRIQMDANNFTLMLFENNDLSGRTENYSCEVQEYQNINGIIFPTKFIITFQSSSSKLTYEYLLSDINFNELSERDFRFAMTLPNGTPVVMQDARQIQYIWLDGKIVPKTDEAMLAIAMGDHKFMPGPDSPRFWLMAIGIILILIGVGRLAYRYFRGEATL